MEVGACRKRFVCLPEERSFDEQNAKAKGLEQIGLAVRIKRWPSAEDWPKVLAKAAALDSQAWAPYFHARPWPRPQPASSASPPKAKMCPPAARKPVPSFW